jgi:hypothetical protein
VRCSREADAVTVMLRRSVATGVPVCGPFCAGAGTGESDEEEDEEGEEDAT